MNEAPAEAFGPYLVYEQLGIGGMASVHRAEVAGIEGFRREVALKRMLPHVAANEDMVKAFVREANLASHLRHQNVAQTHELGKVGDIYFIAMELITGPTLRDVLKHCGATTGPMPVPVALNLINQICDALDYAHNLCDESGQPLGIIHRDVSPSNIIVADGGVAKLIDFGIAKASAAGMQTMSGTIKGKFGYMAPEYIAGSIDARADLFAVGVISHELLTNRPLFSGPDDMETLQRVVGMQVVPPSATNPQVPPEIDGIVMTALARDPNARWQNATALRTAMTTLTKRLDMVVSNMQVLEWITWALEQTKPRGKNLRVQLPTPVRAHVAQPALLSSTEYPTVNLTPLPSDSMTITQVDGPPAVVHSRASDSHEYRNAIEAYERHDALIPTPSLMADDVVPTLVRASGPHIVPGRGSDPGVAVPRTTTPGQLPAVSRTTTPGQLPAVSRTTTPRQPPTRTSSPSSQPPNRTSSPSSQPPNRTSSPSSQPPNRTSSPSSQPPNRGSTPSVQPPNTAASPFSIAPTTLDGKPLGSRPTTEAVPAKGDAGIGTAVVLVLLAAAVAAAGVYFLLPYLT